jgi:hypothetical protein
MVSCSRFVSPEKVPFKASKILRPDNFKTWIEVWAKFYQDCLVYITKHIGWKFQELFWYDVLEQQSNA